MATTSNLTNINLLTEAQYNNINPNSNELYAVEYDTNYVYLNTTMIESYPLYGGESCTLDLSDILPDDEYTYDVDVQILGALGSTVAAAQATLYLSSDIETNIYSKCVASLRNGVAVTSTPVFGNSVKIVVGRDRYIIVTNASSYECYGLQLDIVGYRRIM